MTDQSSEGIFNKWIKMISYYFYNFAKTSEFVEGKFVVVSMQKQITNPHHKKPLE